MSPHKQEAIRIWQRIEHVRASYQNSSDIKSEMGYIVVVIFDCLVNQTSSGVTLIHVFLCINNEKSFISGELRHNACWWGGVGLVGAGCLSTRHYNALGKHMFELLRRRNSRVVRYLLFCTVKKLINFCPFKRPPISRLKLLLNRNSPSFTLLLYSRVTNTFPFALIIRL